MRHWKDLTESERERAMEKAYAISLRCLCETGPAFMGCAPGDEVDAAFEAACAEADRMQTPWFIHEYVMDSPVLRRFVRADAKRQAEGAVYLDSGEYTL